MDHTQEKTSVLSSVESLVHSLVSEQRKSFVLIGYQVNEDGTPGKEIVEFHGSPIEVAGLVSLLQIRLDALTHAMETYYGKPAPEEVQYKQLEKEIEQLKQQINPAL